MEKKNSEIQLNSGLASKNDYDIEEEKVENKEKELNKKSTSKKMKMPLSYKLIIFKN